ncbi:MAG: hypothetical protein U1A77_12425 [Pirellulales bacterium]
MSATTSTPLPGLTTSLGTSVHSNSTRPPGLWEDVEFDLELRHAAQVIQRVESTLAGFEPARSRESAANDSSPTKTVQQNSNRETLGQPFVSQSAEPTVARAEQKSSIAAFVLGALLLLAGLTFLAMAVVDQRPDWWQPGLPLALLGQAALTAGVAMRQDWLGRDRR